MNSRKGSVLKSLHVTEKTSTLQSLSELDSNPCISKCKEPKLVFVVDIRANKNEIRQEIEEIYKAQNIKVRKVNTIVQKGKSKRVRGQQGKRGETSKIKKAIVTFCEGSQIDFDS